MKASSTAAPAEPAPREHARMSRAQFFSVLGLVLALFVFEAGPVWRHPWDMDLLNRAIFWSYVAIPLLVIGCLAWSRHLSIRGFVVDTLALVLVKYTCTFAFALVLWEVTPAPYPLHEAALPHGSRITAVEAIPAATPIDPAKTGAVTGTVTDAAGHPVGGALVWIAGGLEEYVFAAPSTPVPIARAEAAARSPLAVVQAHQPILARSTDGSLHTLVATNDGKTLFNTPLLASGEPTHATFHEAEGLVTLHCNVHPPSGEADAQILVVGHPFFARTDEHGRFALDGVPGARATLAVTVDGQSAPERTVDVAAGAETKVEMTIGAVMTAAGGAEHAALDGTLR